MGTRGVWLGIGAFLLSTYAARSDCTLVIPAAAAGSYHQPYYFYDDHDGYYEAGFQSYAPGGVEARNYFVFDVPEFSAPLVAAEIRLYAGRLDTPGSFVPFELHSVEVYPPLVPLHSPDYGLIFDDLGDGAILGQRNVLLAEAVRNFWDHGALIQVPLNTAGMNELTQKQGAQIAFGGIVPTNVQSVFPRRAFGDTSPFLQPVHLVLYFSNAGPAEITQAPPSLDSEVLATDRFNLAAAVCGKFPLTRQWFKNGAPVPNATNDVLEIRSMTQSDGGSYSMVASNEFGAQSAHIADLEFAPLYVSSAPQEIFVGTGDPLFIYFDYASRLPTTAEWRKDGTNWAGQTNAFINLAHATVPDSGVYEVVFSNSAGSRTSGVATVSVGIRPPVFVNDYLDSTVLPVGAQFELSKFVTGDPPIYYQWYRDRQEVPGATSNYLRIASVGFNDAGAYELVAVNAATRATSQVYYLSVDSLVIYNDYDQEAILGIPFTFGTFVDSYFPVTVQWYFNDEPLPYGTNMPLGFAAADYTNAGPYFVTASNAYGMKTSMVFTLTVTPQEPTVDLNRERWQGWVGESLTLYGSVSGGPPPTIEWYFNDTLIPGASSPTLELKA